MKQSISSLKVIGDFARINAREVDTEFPFDKYDILVVSETDKYMFPHFHIKVRKKDCEARFTLDGRFHGFIKGHCNTRLIETKLMTWFNRTNNSFKTHTNKAIVEYWWDAQNNFE